MKGKKDDIPKMLGATCAVALAVVTSEISTPTLLGIAGVASSLSTGIAANLLTEFTPRKIKRWFLDTHPGDMNHSLKKLFVKSIQDALANVAILYSESSATAEEKKTAKKTLQTLRSRVPALMNGDRITISDEDIHRLLRVDAASGAENRVEVYLLENFTGIAAGDSLKSFLAQHLIPQIQLCFGEGLKDTEHNDAWIAYQRLLADELQDSLNRIETATKEISGGGGLSGKEMQELRQLKELLQNKELIKVKIRSGVADALKAIEAKEDEIIRVTTDTNFTVNDIKNIVKKIARQNQIIHIALGIVICALVCALVGGVSFFLVRLHQQPFTTTVKVHGWKGESHIPLKGKGHIKITLGDKPDRSPINADGEAIFRQVPSVYDGRDVPIEIDDTGDEPWYLVEKSVRLGKNRAGLVEVRLRGLERFSGQVLDSRTNEGLPDVTVYIAGVETVTDERGGFSVEIPLERQETSQEVVLSKAGYETRRWTHIMGGGAPWRGHLKR
jgi:hypothetical protein